MQEKSIQAPKHQLLAIKKILLASTGLLSFLNYAAACDYSALLERQLIARMPGQQALGQAGNCPLLCRDCLSWRSLAGFISQCLVITAGIFKSACMP